MVKEKILQVQREVIKNSYKTNHVIPYVHVHVLIAEAIYGSKV